MPATVAASPLSIWRRRSSSPSVALIVVNVSTMASLAGPPWTRSR
jgi:hypothetical protein